MLVVVARITSRAGAAPTEMAKTASSRTVSRMRVVSFACTLGADLDNDVDNPHNIDASPFQMREACRFPDRPSSRRLARRLPARCHPQVG